MCNRFTFLDAYLKMFFLLFFSNENKSIIKNIDGYGYFWVLFYLSPSSSHFFTLVKIFKDKECFIMNARKTAFKIRQSCFFGTIKKTISKGLLLVAFNKLRSIISSFKSSSLWLSLLHWAEQFLLWKRGIPLALPISKLLMGLK